MRLPHVIPQWSFGVSIFCFITMAQAGKPLWTFTPDKNFPPKISVSTTGTATVLYTVANNSSKPHNLVLKPQVGISQNTPCTLGPKGSGNATCQLTLTIHGSELPASGIAGGPALCQENPDGSPNFNQCYQPNQADVLTVTVAQAGPLLSTSTTNLALSVTGLTLNSLLSGQPRVITITNTGNSSASGLSFINANSWPLNTKATSDCNGDLEPGSSCTITVIPGPTATSGANSTPCTTGIEPIPSVVSVTSTNANTVSTSVVVLGYACIYQSGFIYAMIETADTSKSIGGNVVSLNDQAPPNLGGSPQPGSLIWSSNGQGSASVNVSYDLIPGIDETSTPGSPSPSYSDFSTYFSSNYIPSTPLPPSVFNACLGESDGKCNTQNILTYYNTYITNYSAIGSPPFTVSSGPTPLIYYAAGLCAKSIDGYSDWYLPALCEMGLCAPGEQNMESSLLPVLFGSPVAPNPSTSCPLGHSCLAGIYWSSTESNTLDPINKAFFNNFTLGGSIYLSAPKSALLGVRCARELTI
ncbi:hypothetical protein Lsan_0947 [Legionella santicrucis]|uniref:Transmembrane protein (Fibronectin III domain and Gp5 C-terminal repeat) n=1 Tax=Legionella santicrucis TaxID=45074 RepID=A0A0W0Z526_9GAMM|nr:hypothetical protein [Legionella santicrucis]KTD64252.1 hypothetical protein Lsan_0947 [Legionella santicrucis]